MVTKPEVLRTPEIDQYDQDTLGYLTAVGVSPQLVERVNRMAKDAAHWKAVAGQIADALDARAAEWDTPQPVPDGWDSHHLIVRHASQIATEAAAKIAREVGGAR